MRTYRDGQHDNYGKGGIFANMVLTAASAPTLLV
jgi:hypothetical protein